MLTFEQKMAYLAAFIDTEGWVSCRLGERSNKLHRQIGFTNTNKVLFDKMISFAAEAGLEFSVHAPKMKNSRHSQRYDAILIGGRSAYEKLEVLVPLQHPEKQARLQEILGRYLSLDQAKRKRAQGWRDSMSRERQLEIAKYARSHRGGGYAMDRS